MTTRTIFSFRTVILTAIFCMVLTPVTKADSSAAIVAVAQEKREFMKLSPSLAKVAGQNAAKGSNRRVLSLLTFSKADQSSSLLDEYPLPIPALIPTPRSIIPTTCTATVRLTHTPDCSTSWTSWPTYPNCLPISQARRSSSSSDVCSR